MPQTRSNLGQTPVNSDTFNLTGDLATLVDSLEVIAPVANTAAGDTVATTRAAAGFAVTDARPLFIWNQATKAIEVKDSSGWRSAGLRIRYMHFKATAFTISGSQVSWDVGPLVVQSGDTINGGFASQSGTSGAVTINESGWYSYHALTMPNGSPGNTLYSLIRNGTQVIYEGGGNGTNWATTAIVPRFYFVAGDSLLMRVSYATGRTADTDLWLHKLD